MKQFWGKRNEGYSLFYFVLHLLFSLLYHNLNPKEVNVNYESYVNCLMKKFSYRELELLIPSLVNMFNEIDETFNSETFLKVYNEQLEDKNYVDYHSR